MHWSLVTAIAVVIIYSLLLIALDEFVAKPWRRRRWQRRAQAGDERVRELLARARTARPAEEE